jgi:hypothetical protein
LLSWDILRICLTKRSEKSWWGRAEADELLTIGTNGRMGELELYSVPKETSELTVKRIAFTG